MKLITLSVARRIAPEQIMSSETVVKMSDEWSSQQRHPDLNPEDRDIELKRMTQFLEMLPASSLRRSCTVEMVKPWLCTERKLGLHDRCSLAAWTNNLQPRQWFFHSPFSHYNTSANIPTTSNVNRGIASSSSNQGHIRTY
jgi:hypothetical protein